MTWTPLRLDGALEFQPAVFGDDRGFFFEAFTASHVVAATSMPSPVAQVNVSSSTRGTIRGIHYADVPPGQAKFVQCLAGEILDVLVDLPVGSATLGQWTSVTLTSSAHNAVLIPIGFGHAFQALSETALVMYCCNTPYNPTGKHGIHSLDVDLAITWAPPHAAALTERRRRTQLGPDAGSGQPADPRQLPNA